MNIDRLCNVTITVCSLAIALPALERIATQAREAWTAQRPKLLEVDPPGFAAARAALMDDLRRPT